MVKVKPIGFGGVDAILNGKVMPGLQVRGALGKSAGFGSIRFGMAVMGDERTNQGIYQKRVTGYNHTGRIAGRERRSYYVLMRSYRPSNPQTPAQQANRAKFADASHAWSVLTPVDKSVYNERGIRRNRVPRHVFISEYMKSH